MYGVYNESKITAIVILGSIFNAASLNIFLIPAHVYASGFTGAAQLLSTLLENTPVPLSTGLLLLLLNLPVTYLGWKRVGKRFTFYSFFSVVMTTICLTIIPVNPLSDNILLNAVFGGVIGAIGVGLTLKWGASTGGMDIIALVLSRMKDRPVGLYFFALNGLITLSAGLLFGGEEALFTLVSLYASSRVIDAIHTRHQKLTAMIITGKGEEIQKAIHDKMVRGITRVPAKGAFHGEDKEILIIVITRYELFQLEQTIKAVDPTAFTNIVQTAGIFGFFRTDTV
ncbi:MAG TPA: YitT family protein [Bacillales bacterium]|nr:YitT family protein [Bacillales bacterium]